MSVAGRSRVLGLGEIVSVQYGDGELDVARADGPDAAAGFIQASLANPVLVQTRGVPYRRRAPHTDARQQIVPPLLPHSLMTFLRELFSTPWFGSTLGVLGILVAVFTHLRTRTVRRLVYQQHGVRLIGGDNPALPPEVEVTFCGAPVPRLTKSTLVFWNAGNTTIRGSDIVRADPLCIALFDDARVLDVRVVQVKRSVCGITVAHAIDDDPAEVRVSFDFLDPQDGARIEVLHTSSRTAAVLVGTLRGLPQGCTYWGRIPATKSSETNGRARPVARWAGFLLGRQQARITPLATLILFSMAVGGAFLGALYYAIGSFAHAVAGSASPSPSWLSSLIAGAVLAMYGALLLLLLWSERRRFPRELDDAATDAAE